MKTIVYLIRFTFMLAVMSVVLACGVLVKPAKLMQTDLLLPVAGFEGGLIGAKVDSVVPIVTAKDGEELTEVNVVVPSTAGSIDMVKAFDKSGQRISFAKQPIITQQNQDQAGVALYFKDKNPVPFILRLHYAGQE